MSCDPVHKSSNPHVGYDSSAQNNVSNLANMISSAPSVLILMKHT